MGAGAESRQPLGLAVVGGLLRMVHTSKARSKIKRWLKQQGFEQSKALGEEILDRELKKAHLNLPEPNDMEDIAQGMGFLSAEALLAAIGDGTISVQQVMTKIIPEQMPEVKQSVVKRFFDTARGDKGIRIQGMGNMMFRFAGCCQPVPGEQIIGFITRGRGITIHRADCSMVQELSRSPERLIQVEWDADKGQAFIVKLDILLEDRKNMLRDITQVISDTDANVRGAEISGKGGPVVGSFVVEIKNLSHLNRVIEKVKKIKGVISIERAKGVDIDTMAGSDGAVS